MHFIRAASGISGGGLIVAAVAIALARSEAWPFAIAALAIGAGLAYAALTGQTIRKLGPGGIELDPRELVREVGKQVSLRAEVHAQSKVRGNLTVRNSGDVVVRPEPARARLQTYPPTVHVSVSDSATGTDTASVEKSETVSVEKYEQLAMFADSPAELAKVILDFIEATRLERQSHEDAQDKRAG